MHSNRILDSMVLCKHTFCTLPQANGVLVASEGAGGGGRARAWGSNACLHLYTQAPLTAGAPHRTAHPLHCVGQASKTAKARRGVGGAPAVAGEGMVNWVG